MPAADMLDEIVRLDETLVQRGFDEGARAGRARGEEDGLQLGRLKGAEVAVRVALFRGRLDAFINLAEKHPSVFPKRAAIALDQVKQALKVAERELLDPGSHDGFEALETTETKLLAVASLLKLSQRPAHETQTLDF